ncbi:MAG TPA: IPT/TIG domain-containing protein [Bryobacteraceae bacterium]|nr:IPT/TIG domain-containing protein [Bryobacteraceae bacterium]
MGKILFACGVLACALQAQTITTTPSILTFTYQSGAASLPAAQTISVKASAGAPTYTTAIAPANTFWVTASPNSGALPATISVRVNPTSLAVGQYNAAVDLTITGIGTPVVIAVNLVVTESASTLAITPTILNLTGPPDPPAQTVTLTTDGGPISFTATSGASWMTVTPTVGVVLPGDSVTLTIAVTTAGLAAQTAPYTGKVTIVASGTAVTTKSQSVTVNLTVISLTPTITNIWPPTLPVGAGAQTITIFGTNFYSATVAMVQGVAAPLATTVVSPTALLAVVPSGLLTASGVLNVMAVNPPPGGASAGMAVPVTSAPSIAGIFSAASYASATVSPGELVTIFGTNIGPPIPASLTITNGYVNTSLNGVSVTIDGVAAPVLYVSANQVTVQVPYEVTTPSVDNVVLTNGGNPPANSTVTTALTAPGIFTANGSGTGEAAALNNGATGTITLNSGTNLAVIGEIVTLYLTGEGDYNLPGLSGVPGQTNTGYIIPTSITPPLPELAPLPTVTIGGVDASAGVTYAGVVPGSILGVLQINVTIPTGAATGTAVPVTVTIGGNTTQANVTLGIHP